MRTGTEPYKRGLRSGLEDWRVVGPPHATRPCPEQGLGNASDWFLGRCHGFQEAQSLLPNKNLHLTTPNKPEKT